MTRLLPPRSKDHVIRGNFGLACCNPRVGVGRFRVGYIAANEDIGERVIINL